MAKKVALFIGRTCSGKTSVAKELEKKYGLKVLKSYTTRPMRDGEEDSTVADHIFISEEEMRSLKKDSIAYTKIGDYEYCATYDQLLKSDIYVIDPRGFYDLMACYDDYACDVEFVLIYFAVDYDTSSLRSRINRHCENTVRFYDEANMFDKFEDELLSGEFYYIPQANIKIIVNDKNKTFPMIVNRVIDCMTEFDMMPAIPFDMPSAKMYLKAVMKGDSPTLQEFLYASRIPLLTNADITFIVGKYNNSLFDFLVSCIDGRYDHFDALPMLCHVILRLFMDDNMASILEFLCDYHNVEFDKLSAEYYDITWRDGKK